MSIRRNSGLGTWRAFILAAVAIAAGGVLLSGQITVPNTFVNGTVADAPQVNANFNTLASNALNRTGGTMTGTLTTQAVLPSADATYALGSGAFRYTTGNFSGLLTAGTGTFSGLVTGGSFAGTGAALTTLSAANISAGILASARGGVGIDASAPTDGQLFIGKTSDGSWNKQTLTAGTGISVTNGAGTVTIANTSVNLMTLLRGASGTDATAGLATSDTVAISGLTALDSLWVIATLEDSASAQPVLYNSTDAVTMSTASGNANTTAQTFVWLLTASQNDTKKIATLFTDPTAVNSSNTTSTFVTDWTGSWTLGLRHATNTGTFKYRWRVLKLAGQ